MIGCASNHNFASGGYSAFGGGYSEQIVTTGLYEITAIADVAPWPNAASAMSTLKARGAALCGTSSFQEIVVGQSNEHRGTSSVVAGPGQVLSLPKYHAVIRGYVLCSSSGMTRDQAIKYVEDQRVARLNEVIAVREKELSELGGRDCGSPTTADSPDRYLRRGKLLSSIGDYKSAMACFNQALQSDPASDAHRGACFEIGTLYELGWGVEKDVVTAMTWYKKAGL
jgi:tetratricopeptide (TPR) repeat protein